MYFAGKAVVMVVAESQLMQGLDLGSKSTSWSYGVVVVVVASQQFYKLASIPKASTLMPTPRFRAYEQRVEKAYEIEIVHVRGHVIPMEPHLATSRRLFVSSSLKCDKPFLELVPGLRRLRVPWRLCFY